MRRTFMWSANRSFVEQEFVATSAMKIVWLLSVLGLAGCATNYRQAPKSWQAVRLGMTRHEVLALAGQPVSHEPGVYDAGKDTLIYERDHWEVRTGPFTVSGFDVSYDKKGQAVSVGPSKSTEIKK